MALSQIKLLVGGPVAPFNFPGGQIFALSTGTIQPPTETQIVVSTDFGYRFVFKGTFTIVGGVVTAGTVTGYDVFTGSTKVINGSNYSTSGADLFDALQTHDDHALDNLLFNVPLKVIGSNKDDHAVGSDFNDNLSGRAGNDWLQGWTGDDVIKGGKGNDFIDGGDGNDKLYGGPGDDVFGFWFDPVSRPVGFDRIKDFKVGEDLIGLNFFEPDAPPPGYLGKQYFRKGTEATTDQQVIIYDKKTGRIFYDADGTGPEAQFLLAKVKAGTKLNADDFYVQTLIS